MKKIDKEFCISDDSVNVYGYRLLTSGLELSRFNPPIGFLMHERDKGVAVKWEDFRTEVGKVFAKPVINDELFPQLAQQIEEGFYNAASVGHIVALEVSDEPGTKLEGQTGPTVTKWFCREVSIVDIPGNYNAIAQLYDESDNVLHDLSSFIQPNNAENMKDTSKPTGAMVAVALLNLPDLKDDATAEQAVMAVKKLIDRAADAEKRNAELTSLLTAMQIDGALDRAVKERKISPALAEQLKADYKDNPCGLKNLIDKMPAQSLITEKLSQDIPDKYKGKSYRDLYLSGELEEVKRDYPALYEKLKVENS